ncbi:unnamed protein product [Closterium sp. NIES-65]|nr:unnamed protein product [Closterium sp. NIES-65]
MAQTKQGVSKINKAAAAAGRGRGGARGKDIANGGEKKQIGMTSLELRQLKVASAEFHREQLREAVGGGKKVDKRHGEGSSGVNCGTHRDDNVEDGVDGEDRERDDGDDDSVAGTAGQTSADGGTAARADGDEDKAGEEMVAADEEKDEEEEGDAEEEEEGDAEEEAKEEEEGDAEEEEEGDAEEEEGDSEEGSGDDSEEEVYTGDGEEAEDDNAEDYDDLEEEGMEDTEGDGGERAKKRRRGGNGKGKKAAGGRGWGGGKGAAGGKEVGGGEGGGVVVPVTHMQGQHLNHWIIWLRKLHGGEVGQNDHFPEGGYGVDDEVPDGGVKWVGADTWPAPPTEGVPARKGQQLITQTYPKCFDKDYLQQAMCECVVATDQAFTVVEHPTFRNMMAAANPECAVERVIPSRSTLARQIIRLAGLARITLMEMLAADGVGAVALTHDIWTGENHRSYISLTGHCVNEKFELMQITLDFRAMPGKQNSARIIEVLLDVVKEWKLEKRRIAVTSDNASANVAAMEFFCRGGPTDRQPPLFFSGMHVRCMGHICNLAIQLGLKTMLDIKEPLGIIRDLASFIGLSPKRTTLFEKIQKRADEKARILRLRGDNEAILTAKDAKRLQALTLSSEQWLALEELAAFLKPFHAVSLAAEGSKYPTISRVVPQFNELLDGLDTLKNSVSSPPSGVMKDCITKAEEKLMEYYSDSSDELWVATILDPSFKIGYFEMDGEGGDKESERPRGVHHVAVERVLALVWAKLVPYKAKAVAAREKRERAEGAGRGARGRGGGNSSGGSSSGRGGGAGRKGGAAGGRPAIDSFGGVDGDRRSLRARLEEYRSRQEESVRDEVQIYIDERLEPLGCKLGKAAAKLLELAEADAVGVEMDEEQPK